jgi:hypothetical protein
MMIPRTMLQKIATTTPMMTRMPPMLMPGFTGSAFQPGDSPSRCRRSEYPVSVVTMRRSAELSDADWCARRADRWAAARRGRRPCFRSAGTTSTTPVLARCPRSHDRWKRRPSGRGRRLRSPVRRRRGTPVPSARRSAPGGDRWGNRGFELDHPTCSSSNVMPDRLNAQSPPGRVGGRIRHGGHPSRSSKRPGRLTNRAPLCARSWGARAQFHCEALGCWLQGNAEDGGRQPARSDPGTPNRKRRRVPNSMPEGAGSGRIRA